MVCLLVVLKQQKNIFALKYNHNSGTIYLNVGVQQAWVNIGNELGYTSYMIWMVFEITSKGLLSIFIQFLDKIVTALVRNPHKSCIKYSLDYKCQIFPKIYKQPCMVLILHFRDLL